MVFNNTNEFKEKFNFSPAAESQAQSEDTYFGFVALRDRKVGFSIKRRYPKNIAYKPSVTREGQDNNVATLWVTYLHPTESKKTLDTQKIPLKIKISNMDLYISENWDYDFEDAKSPTKDSIERSKRTRKPIELESRDEYFYDHTNNCFIDSKGRTLTGIEMLDEIYYQHCNTVHAIKGFTLRAKIFSQSIVYHSLGYTIDLIILILKTVFGRTLQEPDDFSDLFYDKSQASLKKLSTDNLEIFGYKAPKGVIVLLCGIIVLQSVTSSHIDNSYIYLISDKETLILAHSLFALWVLDSVIPYFLHQTIKVIDIFRRKLLGLKFKAI